MERTTRGSMTTSMLSPSLDNVCPIQRALKEDDFKGLRKVIIIFLAFHITAAGNLLNYSILLPHVISFFTIYDNAAVRVPMDLHTWMTAVLFSR
jgi:Sec-independent protein secretion pathway component TatC